MGSLEKNKQNTHKWDTEVHVNTVIIVQMGQLSIF